MKKRLKTGWKIQTSLKDKFAVFTVEKNITQINVIKSSVTIAKRVDMLLNTVSSLKNVANVEVLIIWRVIVRPLILTDRINCV
jgi:hypothetical protein